MEGSRRARDKLMTHDKRVSSGLSAKEPINFFFLLPVENNPLTDVRMGEDFRQLT